MTPTIYRTDEAATVAALLVSADVAGPMCGRSEASWWRDHAAARIPAPVKLGGRTMWRVQELRHWVEAGCPARKFWEALQAGRKGDR
jgi:predicted DNA-binding transcriptional regulator AlpA